MNKQLIKKMIKPPLGVMPRVDWEAMRVAEIEAAIKRYGLFGKAIPKEWIEEADELVFKNL